MWSLSDYNHHYYNWYQYRHHHLRIPVEFKYGGVAGVVISMLKSLPPAAADRAHFQHLPEACHVSILHQVPLPHLLNREGSTKGRRVILFLMTLMVVVVVVEVNPKNSYGENWTTNLLSVIHRQEVSKTHSTLVFERRKLHQEEHAIIKIKHTREAHFK